MPIAPSNGTYSKQSKEILRSRETESIRPGAENQDRKTESQEFGGNDAEAGLCEENSPASCLFHPAHPLGPILGQKPESPKVDTPLLPAGLSQ